MAAALGAKVTLVTRLTPEVDTAIFAGIELKALAGGDVARYANRYGAEGDRMQMLLGPGEPLAASETAGLEADILIVAPAYHELTAFPLVKARYTAVALQGMLRTVREGHVCQRPLSPATLKRFAPEGAYVFFSDEDAAEPEILAAAIARLGATAVLTRGNRGATFYTKTGEWQVAPFAAQPVDPTGAGDCFSTAFTTRLAETEDPAEAARFAAAAGSLVTEGEGLEGVPSRESIEERMLREAA